MRIVFYLLPCIMNVVMGAFFFITARRMAAGGGAGVAVAGTMAVWAGVYTVVSALLGAFQNRRNAVRLIAAGELILIGALLGLLLVPSLGMQYFWLLLTGVGTALFFAPFQVVVKALEPDEGAMGSLVKSASLYTFSWSSGFATGPLLAALIWGWLSPENGWRICYLLAIAVLLLVLAAVWALGIFLKRKVSERAPDGASAEAVTGEALPAGRPDLVWLGWIFGGIGFVTIAVVRTNIPYYCTQIGMGTAEQGVLLALLSYVLSLTALCFVRSRDWMYRRTVYLSAGILGAVAQLIFGLTRSYPLFLAAAVFYGVYAGVFCFVLVYHSLANAVKSPRYVAVNETLVGATGMLAPLAGGMIADRFTGALPFLLSGGMTVFSLFYVCFALKKAQKMLTKTIS